MIAMIKLSIEKYGIKTMLGEPKESILVEPGIVEHVTVLLENGIKTYGSCEGHPDNNGCKTYPWVQVDNSDIAKAVEILWNNSLDACIIGTHPTPSEYEVANMMSGTYNRLRMNGYSFMMADDIRFIDCGEVWHD